MDVVLYSSSWFVRGHHSNFLAVTPPWIGLRLLVGHFFPEWAYPQIEDRKYFSPVTGMFSVLLRETGYWHIQATKPDTIGHALTDSPVGLAAYILDKFAFPTNPDYINYPDGKLTEKFEMDELLNNIMVYWISGSITTSARSYKELAGSLMDMTKLASLKISVPTGYAAFPQEAGLRCPEHWLPHRYTNIISYTAMPRGGHFAALEEPELLAEDIRQFSMAVEEFWLRDSEKS